MARTTTMYNKLVQQGVIPGRHVEEHKAFTPTDMRYIHTMNNKVSDYQAKKRD